MKSKVLEHLRLAWEKLAVSHAVRPAGADRFDLVNSYYVTSAPSPQNALDIFRGEWSSKLPPPLDGCQAGHMELFQDGRITWLISEVGDLRGRHILELGPLEGGHSYMLERAGAESITAVEANTHAYLRCLVVKELLDMQRVKFLCGDCVEYLRSPDCPQFDIGVASGILYHVANPAELIALLAQHCQAYIFVWTHYYDDAWAKSQGFQKRFPFAEKNTYAGFSHTLVRQYYDDKGLRAPSFCGGSRPFSNWMYREEILACLKYFGFSDLKVNFDHYDHPNGPAFAVLASRS